MTEKFWQLHPALFYGFAALLGCLTAFNLSWTFALPLTLFFNYDFSFSPSYLIRLLLAFLIGLVFFIYSTTFYQLPSLPEEGVVGMSHVHIESIFQSSTHYGKQWVYKGIIKKFVPLKSEEENYNGCRIPFCLILQATPPLLRPIADCDYVVKGRLKSNLNGIYLLVIKKEEPWLKLNETFSLAEWRYQVKKKVSDYIRRHILNPLSASFLTGIMTGNFDNRLMQFEFSRFGLQHIMAISGFHFAIVTSILGFLLRLAVSPKKATLALIFIISSYFMVLGPAPSVIRAWLTILIALCGFLFSKRGNSLNSLGFSMLLVLLYDPLMSKQIAFQLSFLATAAILLLYNGIEYRLQNIFLKRSLSHAIVMNRFCQHSYLLLSYCRQGLALSLAVNLATLPLVLYYFHKFSLLSLAYNLFFPFMVSLSMVMLIFGFLISAFFSPAGQLIHFINNYYTNFMLNYIYNMPKSIDLIWTVEEIPLFIVVFLLCLVFHIGLWMYQSTEEQREQQHDFAYI